MIRHIVMWKLKAEDEVEQKKAAAEMAAALEPLVGQIEGLESLTVRQDVGDVPNNFDVVLVSEHTSKEALAAYAVHPLHVAAAAVPVAHARERAAVDFEF